MRDAIIHLNPQGTDLDDARKEINLLQGFWFKSGNGWMCAVPPCVGLCGLGFGGIDVHPLLCAFIFYLS